MTNSRADSNNSQVKIPGDRPIPFAVVGCGRISGKHCDALGEKLPGAKLAAVCDLLEERASAVGKKYGVPYYLNYDDMMRSHPEVQVVNVLTPSGMHADHVIDLARYQKHIVVEKPMALTVSDAERMIRACDDAGVRLFVVKQNRMNPPVRLLHQAVRSGKFGKMVMATARVRWCRTQDYYDQDEWRGTWALDGGVLMNQASHHVDLLTWMMGDVDSVFAYGATRLVNIETEDTAVGVLRFHSGALGIIEATTATRPTDIEGSLSVLGESGSVEIGGFAVNEMKHWRFSGESEAESRKAMGVSQSVPNVYGHGHIAYLGNVIETIRTGRSSAVDGIEGMKSLILVNALYESMETGKEIPLMFRPRFSKIGSRT